MDTKVGPPFTCVDPLNAASIHIARPLATPVTLALGRRLVPHLNEVIDNSDRPMQPVADPRDWDEASHAVSDAYFPHALHPLTHSTASDVSVDSMAIGPVRIAHIGWGAPVTVDTDHPAVTP